MFRVARLAYRSHPVRAIPFLIAGLLLVTATAGPAPAPQPPGQLVDVQGRKLHIICRGRGSPPVILESGAGEFSLDWALAIPAIASVTRVCAWDRAGYAWSDRSPQFEEFPAVAEDMRELLRRSGIQPPWILAGHAMGALYARDYLRRYPADGAGLVLVDPTPEQDVLVQMFSHTVPLIDMADHDLLAWPIRPFALSRTSPPPKRSSLKDGVAAPFDKLPPSLRAARQWALERLFAELDELDAEQAHAVMESQRIALFDLYTDRHRGPLALPVVVLSRGKDTSPALGAMQDEIARISRNAIHKTVESSGSQIQIEQPELVASAVTGMVKSLRRKGR
jgi:pimeloyl-ACP methyl ester carboxylesterase